MVVPWVMFITLSIIVLSVWMLVRSLTYFTAADAAEKAAFAWPHSAAELRTGAYPYGSYDGLYWRLKDDALLSGLFGVDAADAETTVPIGGLASDSRGKTSLSEKKLLKTADAYPSGTGAVTYRNRLWKRAISVSAAVPSLPSFFAAWAGPGAGQTGASSLVSEPAEWLRSFDLVRYYRAKMRARGAEQGEYRGQAARVLEGLG
jgi:hypothetical protein